MNRLPYILAYEAGEGGLAAIRNYTRLSPTPSQLLLHTSVPFIKLMINATVEIYQNTLVSEISASQKRSFLSSVVAFLLPGGA